MRSKCELVLNRAKQTIKKQRKEKKRKRNQVTKTKRTRFYENRIANSLTETHFSTQ